MRAHKNRIDRLEQRLPADDDGEIVIIRLTWPEQDPIPPVTLRRGRGGHLIRKIGIDTIPGHLRGPAVTVMHNED